MDLRANPVEACCVRHGAAVFALVALIGCGNDASQPAPGEQSDGGAADSGVTNPRDASAPSDAGSPGDAAASVDDAGRPAGWLYTGGNRIYVSNGSSPGTPWMGRGVNIDDIFLCGYNNMLATSAPDQIFETMLGNLLRDWKPNFLRVSLGMASEGVVTSWLNNPAQYKTPMTNVINAIGASPNVYALVTLRSDASMIGQDTVDGDPEATGIPSDSTTTPNATMFPSGTDATYVALVDSFASASFVLFGLTNEPGGNKLSSDAIAGAMTHAVGTIRAEEDRLHVPHHVVSVQGNAWTSDLSYYASHPIAFDNVVYELHGYPPSSMGYTYPNIPVIIGEYGNLAAGTSDAFYADLEAKGIPNLAWDFEPYSDCAPDLVNVTHDASNLSPTMWGSTVQSYLLMHAH